MRATRLRLTPPSFHHGLRHAAQARASVVPVLLVDDPRVAAEVGDLADSWQVRHKHTHTHTHVTPRRPVPWLALERALRLVETKGMLGVTFWGVSTARVIARVTARTTCQSGAHVCAPPSAAPSHATPRPQPPTPTPPKPCLQGAAAELRDVLLDLGCFTHHVHRAAGCLLTAALDESALPEPGSPEAEAAAADAAAAAFDGVGGGRGGGMSPRAAAAALAGGVGVVLGGVGAGRVTPPKALSPQLRTRLVDLGAHLLRCVLSRPLQHGARWGRQVGFGAYGMGRVAFSFLSSTSAWCGLRALRSRRGAHVARPSHVDVSTALVMLTPHAPACPLLTQLV